ncbi:MAG TPA: hypothetical protein VK639_02950 [Terriglobales bacterium]|nr:hypothetical protein [Terriglobales bacterium]
MNEDLQQLHNLLIAQHQALFAKLDDASDVDEAKMILTEMQEILHRIDVLQGLLFRETTTALRNSLTKVDDANTELTKALKSAGTAADIIKGVGKFLTVVDKAIDLAKTLAPLAV